MATCKGPSRHIALHKNRWAPADCLQGAGLHSFLDA
jgi:hypothetical protein